MKIGSLFSGYGGLDLACEAFFGAATAWHVEYDAAPSKILAKHWPGVPNYGDVTTVDWQAIEPVDILTGGYPCQPFSAAGKRKGEDDERHLWPFVRQAIRDLRPRFTVLENVAGHRSLGFDRVLGDLAEDGMHVRWTSIRASDIGAPHHRERLFILVTNPSEQSGGVGHGDDVRAWRRGGLQSPAARRSGATDTESQCTRRLPERSGTPVTGPDRGVALLSDSNGGRCGQGSGQSGAGETQEPPTVGGVSPLLDWGAYGPAVQRWERVTRTATASRD